MLAATTVILLFTVLEIGYRAYLSLDGRSHRSSTVRDAWVGQLDWIRRPHGAVGMGAGQSTESDASPVNRRFGQPVLSPYMGVDLEERLDEYGPTAEYFRTEEAGDTFDVVLLGGSVAMLLGSNDAARERLESALAEDPRVAGRKVRLHNQARAGTKAPQTSIVCHLLFQLGWKPDLVILLDGFNEVALANANLRNGAHPLYPAINTWSHLTPAVEYSPADVQLLVAMELAQRRSRRFLDIGLGGALYRSALGSRVVDALLSRPGAQHAAAKGALNRRRNSSSMPMALRGPQVPADLETAMPGMIRVWSESAFSLHAMCAARGIAFLHALQPTLHDAGAKPLSVREAETCRISDQWEEGVLAGYPRLRVEGEHLRERGVAFADGSPMFKGRTETLYRDACHLNPRGSVELAAFLASSARALLKL